MHTYRVYWFDGDSHIEQAGWIEAADDAEAIAIVRGQDSKAGWELWAGARRIAASSDERP